MKKSILISLVFITILSLCGMVNAYSTSKYSIDMPSTYYLVTEGTFADKDGKSINVQISKGDSNGDPYTQENLDRLVNEMYNNVDAYKEQISASLKESYGSYYTDEEIKEYVDSFKCKSVDTKEITTVSKNKYKCFHLVANYEMADYSYYCRQYSIMSGNDIYTITVSAQDKLDLDSQVIEDALDSFTITNYEEPKATNTGDIFKYIGIGAGCGALAGLISYFASKKKKDNNAQ
ncbi:MAG: hypothetical protein IKF97_04495 [Clostridia bacterium]|nr:hypothetical protein [Clostridia bacterium]